MFIFEKPPVKPTKPTCVYEQDSGVSVYCLQKSIFEYIKAAASSVSEVLTDIFIIIYILFIEPFLN